MDNAKHAPFGPHGLIGPFWEKVFLWSIVDFGPIRFFYFLGPFWVRLYSFKSIDQLWPPSGSRETDEVESALST